MLDAPSRVALSTLQYMPVAWLAAGAATLLRLLAQDVALIAIASWLLRRQRMSLIRVGLGRPTRGQMLLGLGLGLLLFAAAYTLGGIMEWGLRSLLWRIGYHLHEAKGTQWAGEAFKALRSQWQKLAFALIGTVAAPFGEEVFFRGFAYNAIKARYGVRAGIVGSALIFALAHAGTPTAFGVVSLSVIFLMGLALAVAYERTGSLWAPILMHAVNNALSFVLLWK